MLVARRKLLRNALALCDALTLLVSFTISYFVVGLLFDRDFISFNAYLWVLGLSIAIWLVCLRSFGLYRSAVYVVCGRLLWRVIQTQFVSGLLLLSAMYLTKSAEISRLLLQSFLVTSFVGLTVQKFALRAYLERLRSRNRPWQRKVLLIAPSGYAERYLRLIRDHSSLLADVIGIVTPARTSDDVAPEPATVYGQVPPVLGAVDDVPALLRTHIVDEVVVVSALDECLVQRLSKWCAVRGIVMRILVETPRPALGVWTADDFGDGAFLLSLAAVPQNPLNLLVKRTMDVAGASVGLLACVGAYVWYGPRLHRETGDSVLFRQQRVGQNGRRFTIYKFRSMCTRAEQLKAGLSAYNEMRGPIFKLSNDPRVTPTGRKLRRRHLDELPQFWNVLRGEMSLIGTRPPTEDEVAAYDEHHHRRLSMKPGLTGLWQLNGNGAVKDFEDVVKLDCNYIDHWSLWLDVKILAKTVAKVMHGDAW